MPIDLNEVGNSHDKRIAVRARALVGPLASMLKRWDDIAMQVGIEVAEQRAKAATAALQGQDPLSGLDSANRRLAEQVLSGEITYEGLQAELAKATESNQSVSQPNVIEGQVVSPSQQLQEAIEQSQQAAENVAKLGQQLQDELAQSLKLVENANQGRLASLKGKDRDSKIDSWIDSINADDVGVSALAEKLKLATAEAKAKSDEVQRLYGLAVQQQPQQPARQLT